MASLYAPHQDGFKPYFTEYFFTVSEEKHVWTRATGSDVITRTLRYLKKKKHSRSSSKVKIYSHVVSHPIQTFFTDVTLLICWRSKDPIHKTVIAAGLAAVALRVERRKEEKIRKKKRRQMWKRKQINAFPKLFPKLEQTLLLVSGITTDCFYAVPRVSRL